MAHLLSWHGSRAKLENPGFIDERIVLDVENTSMNAKMREAFETYAILGR